MKNNYFKSMKNKCCVWSTLGRHSLDTLSTVSKKFATLLFILLLGVGNMWAWQSFYLLGNYTGNNWDSGQTDYNLCGTIENGKYYIDVYTSTGDKYWRLYSNNHYSPSTDNTVMKTDGTGAGQGGYNGAINWKSNEKAGIIRICIDQTDDKEWNPWVWMTRPDVHIKHPWNGGSEWTQYTMTDNKNGTYTYDGIYGGKNTTNVGPGGAKYITNATLVGSPEKGNKCRFTFDANGYLLKGTESQNTGSLTITKILNITYNANNATSGTAPDPVECLYNKSITMATNSGNLAKTGYYFAGWNTKNDGTGTTYLAGTQYTITEDLTLYAKWIPIPIVAAGTYTMSNVTEVANQILGIYQNIIYGRSGSKLTRADAGVPCNSNTMFVLRLNQSAKIQVNYKNTGSSQTKPSISILSITDDVYENISVYQANAVNASSYINSKGTDKGSLEATVAKGTEQLSNQSTELPAGNYKLWTGGSNVTGTYINQIIITSSSSTYTLTISPTPDGYGSVDKTSVASIPSGSAVTTNTNTFTVNGTTVTATPATPDPDDGYTYSFKQWNNLPASVTADVSNVQAEFQRDAKTYTITYENLQGTTKSDQTSYTIESADITLTAPTGTYYGYTFDGWYDGAGGTGNKVTKITTGSKGNKTLYAKWTEDLTTGWYLVGSFTNWATNKVEFLKKTGESTGNVAYVDVNFTMDGDEPEFQIYHGSTYYANRSDKKGDMTYTNCGPWEFNTTTDGKNTIIHRTIAGKYTFKVDLSNSTQNVTVTYPASTKITFNYKGHGGENYSVYIATGGTATAPSTPSESGYRFDGWYDNESFTGSPWNFSTAINADKTFYAKWTQIFTVTYAAGAGTGTMTDSNSPYASGSDVTILANGFTAPTGYEFAGYKDQENTARAAGSKITGINKNYTLTAQWTEIKVTSITADPSSLDIKQGETADVTLSITPSTALDKTITIEDASTTSTALKSGTTYTVTGSSIGTEKDLKFKNTNSDKSATVKVKVYYLVEYNTVGGNSISSVKYYSSSDEITLPTPEKSGNVFKGWYTNSEYSGDPKAAGSKFTPTSNITLYAKWQEILTPTITFSGIPATVYKGGRYAFTVSTNSDATLNTDLLIVSGTGCSLTGKSLNADTKTFSAVLMMTDEAAAPTITLPLPAGTDYSAKTGTSKPTLGSCEGGGTTTLIKAQITADNTVEVKEGSGTATCDGTNIKKGSTEEKYGGYTGYKFNANGARLSISLLNSEKFKSGDNVEVFITKTISKPVYLYSNTDGTTSAGQTTGNMVQGANTITLTSDVSSLNLVRTSDNGWNPYVAYIKVTRGSGSGGSKTDATLAWSEDLSGGVNKTTADADFTYTASSTNCSGAVAYSSSNTEVATINATSGLVHIVGAGTATITAKIANGGYGCFKEKSITYTLNVAPAVTYALLADFTGSETETAITLGTPLEVQNLAQNTTYKLKVKKVSLGTPALHGATSESNSYTTSGTSWTLNGSYYVNLVTCAAGTYQITVTDDNGNPAISITYPTSYTIAYAGNGATSGEMADQTCLASGDKVNLTTNAFVKTGNRFTGWKDQDNQDYTDGQEVTISKSLTLTAQWETVVTAVTIHMADDTHKNLEVGETNQLYVTYTPESPQYGTGIKQWSSDNTAVVTVSSEGLVTAVGPGTTKVHATSNNDVSAEYSITVNSFDCSSWYIHQWNGSSVKNYCMTQVGETHEWRTSEVRLPSASDEEKVIVLKVGDTPAKKADWNLNWVPMIGAQAGDYKRGDGKQFYAGLDALGYFRIFDDNGGPNYYLAFEPTYVAVYGKDITQDSKATQIEFQNVSGHNYQSTLFKVPAGYKDDATYKYYVGTKRHQSSGESPYVYDGWSSVDAMNGVTGLKDEDMQNTYGKFDIHTDYKNPNAYCVFLPYYTYELRNEDETLIYLAPGVWKEAGDKSTTIYNQDLPTKTGYNLIGWSRTKNASTATISLGGAYNYHTSVDIFYPVWQAKTTTVTLNNHGATTAGSTEVVATYDQDMPAATMPTKTGYDFGGYWDGENGTGTQYYNNTGASEHVWNYAGDTKTLHANWSATNYTVTCSPAEHGSVQASKTSNVHYEETITLTVTPALGYRLATLVAKDANNQAVTITNNQFTMPASNVTVTATFEEIPSGECTEITTFTMPDEISKGEKAKDLSKSITGGTAYYRSEYGSNENGGYKLEENNYVGVQLSTGTFAVGDKVTVNLTKVSNIEGHKYLKIMTAKNGGTVLGTIDNPVKGDNEFVLSQATSTVYVSRTSTYNQNPYVKSISVCRPGASSCSAPTAVNITGTTSYEADQTISLTATPVGGEGTPTYQWYRNGVAIDGATTATFTKANCTTADAGAYACKVTRGDDCSKTSHAVQVSVTGATCTAPAITGQPTSVDDANLGSTITFTTTSSEAAYFQWYTCDNQGNNMDPIEGANLASFTLPTSMQKVGTSYFRCKAMAACGEYTLSNTVYASIDPIEFTINYGIYVTNSPISSDNNYAAFTTEKVVKDEAKPYIKDAGLQNISFHGTTTKPSGNGDGTNWSPAIAVPSASTASEYTEFSYFVERDFMMNIEQITIPVMLTAAGATHFEAVLTDEIDQTITGSLDLSEANATGNITFSKTELADSKYMRGTITVKLSVYGQSYRIGKDIYLKGTLTSLPTPTISWKSDALTPQNGYVSSANAEIEATTSADSYCTLTYRSEQTAVADVVTSSDKYYVDYKTVGIANIIATVEGDGIHWNSNPPHSVSREISVECISPTLAWSTAPSATLQVGGSAGSGTVTINSGSTVPDGVELSFESSDEAIATVAQDGLTVTITPVSAGEVTISAKVIGDGTYYCTSAVEIQKDITVSPAAGNYTVQYEMNGADARADETKTTDLAFAVTNPTWNGYDFIGWTVSEGLNPATATCGTTSTPTSPINSCSYICKNSDGTEVYFKNLCGAGGTVTLTANWREQCNQSNGSGQTQDIFAFTVTSSTLNTSSTPYSATNGMATLSGSNMGSGSSNQLTVGNQTYYKLNSSTQWTFTLTSGTFAAGDVITFRFAANSSTTVGVKINGSSTNKCSATISTAKTAAECTYSVVAGDGIAGQSSFYITRDGTSTLFGTVKVTRSGGGGGEVRSCVDVTYQANAEDATGYVIDDVAYTKSDNTIMVSKNDNSLDGLGEYTRSGYTFKEWNDKADGTGNVYTKGQELTNVASNLTLYAIWQSNTTYTVAYNANGGSGEMTDAKSPYNPGSSVVVKVNEFTAPTDKEFDYWTTDQAGTSDHYQGGDEYQINANTTFYAQWKDKTVAQYYTVTYAAGEGATGDVPESDEVLSGDNFVLPSEGNLTKDNHSFTGWNDGTKTYTAGQNYIMPEHNVTLTAQWKINKQSECKKPTSGTYTFENNATVGYTTKKKVTTSATDYNAFSIDNMSFSAMKIEYEDGTGTYGGWKIKTQNATITFCVENDCQVSVKLGAVGSNSGMTITYYKPGASKSTTTTLSEKTTNSYDVAGGKEIVLTTTGKNTVTLKEINVGDKCEVSPDVNDIYAFVKAGVQITEANKKLIGTISLNGKYTYKAGSISAAHEGLTAVYEVDSKDDTKGHVYVYGTPVNDGNKAITHTVTLKFTQTGCTDNEYEVSLTALIGAEGMKRIAYVIDGTETDKGWDKYTDSRLSDALYTKLSADFEVVPVNAYASIDEATIKNYYSQFDVVVITDYPNTLTTKDKVSYSNMLGVLVDYKPVLTMETFVSGLSKWKEKGLTSNPKSPEGDDKTNVMTLLCNANEIFGNTDVGKKDHFAAGSEHTVTTDLTDPCLQGFAAMDAPDYVFIATINGGSTYGTLVTCCERQVEPAARMVVLGMQQKVYSKISDCGYDIVKGLINYLAMSDPASIPDCSLVFHGNNGTSTDWNTAANWEGGITPTKLSPVRIDAPCEVSATGAEAGSVKIHVGTAQSKTYTGSLTIAPTGVLTVVGSVYRVDGSNYSTQLATRSQDLYIQADKTNGSGVLAMGKEEGNDEAKVEQYTLAKMNSATSNRYWQYIALPVDGITFMNQFYGKGVYTYLHDEPTAGGWIRVKYEEGQYFKAYGLTQPAEMKYTFTGHLASTASQTIDLTYNGKDGNEGMNMIGNSWTAPIDITKFEAADFKGTNTEATIYIYNTGNDKENTGETSAQGSTTAGQWISIPVETAKDPKYEGLKVIPAGQAFEVHTGEGGGSISLDYKKLVMNGSRVNEPMRAPERRAVAQDNNVDLMRIRVQGGNTHIDQYLLEGAQFTTGWDNGWDGKYMEGDERAAGFYSINNELGNMAVNALPVLEGTLLGFVPNSNQVYTVTFAYDGATAYYFNDIQMQQSTLIREGESYSFTVSASDMTNRFQISTTPYGSPIVTNLDDTNSDAQGAVKFIEDDHLYIINHGVLYDGQGKLVR